MISLKRAAALVAVVAISAKPIVNRLLRLQTAPLDEDVGAVPVLSIEKLSAHVKGSE